MSVFVVIVAHLHLLALGITLIVYEYYVLSIRLGIQEILLVGLTIHRLGLLADEVVSLIWAGLLNMLVIAFQKGCYRWEILALLVVDGYLYIVLKSTVLVVLSYLLL